MTSSNAAVRFTVALKDALTSALHLLKVSQQLQQALGSSSSSGLTDEYGISGTHVTFNDDEEWNTLADMGFLQRCGVQYHWDNHGYKDFEEFLGTLKASKRKNIRQVMLFGSR